MQTHHRTQRTRTLRDSLDEDDSEEFVSDDDTDDAADADADESLVARVRRVAAPSRMLRRGEVSGGLGDLGTFLPDVVALSKSNPLGGLPNPAAMVFFSGAWSLYAGVAFDLPMPIQPMHAVVAIAVSEGLPYTQVVASAVWLGGFFLVLGGLGLVNLLRRLIPHSVVRGLQLGLGLKVAGTGLTMTLASVSHLSWEALRGGEGLGEALLIGVSALLALGLYGDRHRPASLFLCLIGLGQILYARPYVQLGMHSPLAVVPAISADDWMQALYRAALPQLPVTLLNAVISTSRLAEDLYPRRDEPASVRKISLSIALMNLTSGWFGHFPSCHGCGGLAGQHLFGARTGSSMVLMGLLKMALAVALGPTLLSAIEEFPSSVLGVLLAVSGVELAVAVRDMHDRNDTAVMLIGAALVLKVGTGGAFLISSLAALLFRCRRGFDD